MDTHETCYINLLHDDILTNILSRLPEPTSITYSALACKPWCHIINIHGILRRHRPPDLCGVFRENFTPQSGKHSLLFSPTDQMESPDLIEMSSSFPEDLTESLPDGPWFIIDSYEYLLLLYRYHRPKINNRKAWRVLAIFNPLTGDLQELTQTSTSRRCFFVGAAIQHDDAGNGRCLIMRGASDVFTFKVVCVVAEDLTFDGEGNDECVIRTLVNLAGPGDKWSCISSSGPTRWPFSMMQDRVGDTLLRMFSPPLLGHHGRDVASACSPDSTRVMMLNMRTGKSSLATSPHVSQVLPDNCTFVEYCRGDDNKMWFVTINDLLILRLYSHPKLREEGSTTHIGDGQYWILEREVHLRPQMEELTNTVSELRARNVQSRNGYVFFALDEYGYFAVRLRSMHVQRLSGVPVKYMGRLYPFMLRQDL